VRRLDLDVPCDLIVDEPAEFERLVIERNFVAQALREGTWIDATASPLSSPEKRDLDAARYLADGLRNDLACFACQQAVEKVLKGALVWPASDRPRTHEIFTLVGELARERPGATEALGDVSALDPFYVTTRYPDASGDEPLAAALRDRVAELVLRHVRGRRHARGLCALDQFLTGVALDVDAAVRLALAGQLVARRALAA